MDLNPDQLITLGKIHPRGVAARVLEMANRLILARSSLIIALDRFMADRLETRGQLRQKMLVMPPWPHDDCIADDAGSSGRSTENPFIARHGLAGKFVVMYSGNHGLANPLTTLLDAAVRLKDDPNLRFLFVGGGLGKKEVERYIEEHRLQNAVSLPYEPLSELKHSLSAANVHVVSVGEQMVGIIHPCKIYGAMAVGKPILYLGPRPSHVTDLLDRHQIGRQVRHGDVDAAVEAIAAFRRLDDAALRNIDSDARGVLQREISQSLLCGGLCNRLEQLFAD
jgi:glycosyltransferase involved in cell wall biosynthesis